jgi:hypothetical protein
MGLVRPLHFELAYATLELQLALMFHVPKIYLTRYYTGVFVNLEDTEVIMNHDSFAYNGTHECKEYQSCHISNKNVYTSLVVKSVRPKNDGASSIIVLVGKCQK